VNDKTKKKILVADDTRFFCAILEDLLTSNGYEVMIAHDGLEALKMAKASLPDLDLLVLDLLMPKMTGFDVLREIRKDPDGEKLAVLAITGVFKQSTEIEMLKKLGAVGYIAKNSQPDEILRRVKHALGEEGGEPSDM